MKKPNLFSRLFSDQRNFERPFFLFLSLVLVGMYVWALASSAELTSSWKIVLFTLLMGTHIALYWSSTRVFAHPRWLAPFLIVQGLLAFSMGLLVRLSGFSFGLYPGLIGLVIGMPVKRVWRIVAIGFFLVLSLVNYIVVAGPGAALGWVLGTVPVVVFVTMYVWMYLRQADAREQAQVLLKDLEAANLQLTEYSARVEDLTIASERQRLARELHDTLSQGLAGLILELEAVDAHLAGDRPDRAQTIVRGMMVRARSILADARRAIDDLRQPVGHGLVEAVRKEAESFTSATGIPCDTKIDVAAAVPELVSETAIRAISEGLTNVARHARAKNVTMQLKSIENLLEIEMCDDGIGFDPNAIEAGHYGLQGMRERLRLTGGSLEIHSETGKGTRLVIRFPLEAHAGA
jgi:NarL family two-component system sensor histidine kinase YdfH